MLAEFFEAVRKFGQPVNTADNDSLSARLVYINPALVTTPCFHPRRAFDTAAMLELCASISRFGVINPITVRLSDDGRYETVCGARRLRAAKMLSLEKIPCIVVSADEKDARELSIEENGHNIALCENNIDGKVFPQKETKKTETDSQIVLEHEATEEKCENMHIYNKMEENCSSSRENLQPETQSIKISLKDGRLILNSVNRLAKLAQNCGARASVEISPQSIDENNGNFEMVCLKISVPVQKTSKILDKK